MYITFSLSAHCLARNEGKEVIMGSWVEGKEEIGEGERERERKRERERERERGRERE